MKIQTAFAATVFSCLAHAQQWRVIDPDAGVVRVYSLDAQTLQVFDLNGNPVTTHAVVAPYLQSTGNLVFQKPDNTNLYASREIGTLRWRLDTVSPPASTLPGYLELDGKWYALASAFVQAFYAPNDHSVAASASNCTAGGAALPPAINPKLTLNGIAISLAPEEFLIEHLVNADVIRMKSRGNNISCAGQVPSPIVQEIVFRNGFESAGP